MPRFLLFTKEDADLKRSCSFKVSIEQLPFSIQLAAQLSTLFLHLTAICLFLFIVSLFFYRKLMLHFILCRLCLHDTSQIAFRTGCTHRYAPTLKPQTHVCRLDGPCIIYLVHLDDEIRWPCSSFYILAGKGSFCPQGKGYCIARLFHSNVSFYFSNHITDV